MIWAGNVSFFFCLFETLFSAGTDEGGCWWLVMTTHPVVTLRPPSAAAASLIVWPTVRWRPFSPTDLLYCQSTGNRKDMH